MPLAGLPSLAVAFGEPESHAQLVIGVFLAGFAVAQLVLGPVSDRYGRRPVLLLGLALYALMRVLWDLTTLLVARFVQGVAACSAPVAARAIVADVYEGPDAQRAMSIVTAGMGLAPPIAAPMIGGALLLWFEWPAIFVTLAASGTAMFLAVLLLLQETRHRHHRTELRPARVLLNYLKMLRSRTFLSFSIPSLLAGGALFSFISAAPFVIIGQLGYAPQTFGVIFAIVMVGFITGASLSARLSRTRPPARMMRIGTSVMLAGGITLFLTSIAIACFAILPLIAFQALAPRQR